MDDTRKKTQTKRFDTKELELPDTHYVRDVENRVFQGIVLQCLSKVEGITLVEGNFIDNILGRTSQEGITGITVEQNNKSHTVGVRIDVNILYGYSIPEKAEEIQTLVAEEITRLTGLHVSSVHVVFKSIVLPDQIRKGSLSPDMLPVGKLCRQEEDEYNDEF